MGAKHYHTSAKLNKGVEELFLDLAKREFKPLIIDSVAMDMFCCRGGVSSAI